MKNPNFRIPTPEERAAQQAAYAIEREAQKEAAKDFQVPNPGDYEKWKELAHKHGIRMPNWYTPRTRKYMGRFARRLGYTEKSCREIFGDGWKYEDFAKLNPNKSIQYFVGILLENK